MKAAILESEGHIIIGDTPVPVVDGPGQIQIQIKAVGICGSEVHAFEGTHPYRKAPTILGHEAAGLVTETSNDVVDIKPGDRVIIDPQWTCGACEYCQTGDINLCPHKRVMGTPAWPGAFGEYVIAPQEAVFHLPDHLSWNQGSVVEPLTVGIHVVKRAGLRAGQSVVILGSGSIGGLLSGICSAYGADPIVVADIRQHPMDAARERLGATHDFLLPDVDVVQEVMELTAGGGADIIFVCADDGHLVEMAVKMAKPRGTVVLIALLTHDALSLTAYDIISKERQIIGSSMSNHDDVREALALTAEGRVDVVGIVTHVLPIDQAQRGMELAATKQDDAIKVILTFPEGS